MREAPRRRRVTYWLPFLVATLLVHLIGGYTAYRVGALYELPDRPNPPIQLVVLDPPKKDEPLKDEEDEELDLEGQIVETAKPRDPERPLDSEYLAEHDTTVEKETRSELFDINPEVVAPEYSQESRMEHEDIVDMHIDKPSTGATPGMERFDPDRHGTTAALPSPWTLTNKLGLQDPVPSSHAMSTLSGAPQNDLLDEEVGDATQLNTREIQFASYLLRIRRLVNFYWEQNLSNLPRGTPVSKPRYNTTVMVVLDSDGAVRSIEIAQSAGVTQLDDAVVRAYNIAGPFPNPPEQLISKDGRVYLPAMSWTVQFGQAKNQFMGIDPNAGVQYPGLLKNPR